jgi:hypothetical protein
MDNIIKQIKDLINELKKNNLDEKYIEYLEMEIYKKSSMLKRKRI